MVRRTVHLIRHEKTKANVERRYIGHTDQPILMPVSADIPINPTFIFGSDLLRCQQTAACYFPHALYIADERLREMDFGDFEMKTYEELKDNASYRAWIDTPDLVTPPNGESFAQFRERVMAGFTDITLADATFVVHGGVIQMILSTILNQDFYTLQVKHRVIYTLQWEESGCILLSEAPITVKPIT